MSMPSRDEAMRLLTQYNEASHLITHALAVEGVMRYMAEQAGEDPDHWGLIGLIHDVDYGRYPNEHLQHAPRILSENGWPEDAIRAVVSHGWGICSDVAPETRMEKTLFAIDELTGLVAAAALVRPSRSVMSLPVKSVRKKWKDKRFAAGVDRKIIQKGADLLGVELADLINDTIMGMRSVAKAIGLEGA